MSKSKDPAKVKRPAGRPPLGEELKRGHRIQVPVNPPELALMQAAADASGLSLAEWMRENLLRIARRSTGPQKGV